MGEEKKEPYLLYYRFDGKPRGVSKISFILQSVFFFSVALAGFVFLPWVLALTVSVCFIPLYLIWWGIGIFNVNKSKRRN